MAVGFPREDVYEWDPESFDALENGSREGKPNWQALGARLLPFNAGD